MKRAAGIVALAVASVFAGAGHAGRMAAPGHGILLLQTETILLFTASGRQVGFVRVPFKKTNACGVAWSPDGKRLLVRTSRRRYGLWSVTPGGGGHWRRLPLAIGKSNVDNCAVSWR